MNRKWTTFKRSFIPLLIIAIIAATFSISHANPGESSIPMHPFWQGDYGDILGCQKDDTTCLANRSDKTISGYGCGLTSMAMLYWAYGFYWIPDANHTPLWGNKKLDPARLNEYLSVKNQSGIPIGFDVLSSTNYEFDWLKTSKNFYYYEHYNIGTYYHFIAPNYYCSPYSLSKAASCFVVDWSPSPIHNTLAQTLLDHDLQNWTPPIMKISWTDYTDPKKPEGKLHPTHFVVIAGWDDEKKEYRAHNPAKRDNQDTYPKALNTQYKAPGYDYEMLQLYRYTGAYGDKIDGSYLAYSVHSPVEIQVIDPQGRKTGYDPDTGTKLQENSMSLYYEETPVTSIYGTGDTAEPVKRLSIAEPLEGNYILQIFGTGDGPYTIDIEGAKTDGATNLSTSLTGTASATLRATYRVTYSPTGDATLTQTNNAPIANAGANQTGEQSYEIQLDGSASSDSDGDPLTYSWNIASKPSGSSAALSDTKIVNPTFTPDMAGLYVLQVVVNDYFTDSAQKNLVDGKDMKG